MYCRVFLQLEQYAFYIATDYRGPHWQDITIYDGTEVNLEFALFKKYFEQCRNFRK